MSKQPDIKGVMSAFELLSEQLQATKFQIHNCAIRATEVGEHDRARENQVLNYLTDLEGRVDEKRINDFLLVYLSPNGRGPSESSFPSADPDQWENHYSVMSYAE